MSKLQEALANGRFPIIVELKPPKGIDTAGLLAPIAGLNGRVTAFGVPDNEHAKMRLSALAAARLVREAGGEPLLLLTCRDRNRLALESDLLGASALGIENLLVLTGDYVNQGDHPDAKPVYDADSVQLLQIARTLMAGQDLAGLALQGSPTFYLGAVCIPEADPIGPQLLKIRKKLTAGAEFLVTAPVFDLERLRRFRDQLGPMAAKFIVTVKVPKPEEVAQAAAGQWRKVYSLPPAVIQELHNAGEAFTQKATALAGRLIRDLKSSQLADGVYLKARGKKELITAVLDQAGL